MSDWAASAVELLAELVPLDGKATASLPAVKSCLFLLRLDALAGNDSLGVEYHGS
jgi:hypothetical protein